MALLSKAKGSDSDFKPVPPGTHSARCVSVVDCGFQESEYQGNKSWKEKVYLGFEVPDFRITYEKDGNEIEAPGIIGCLLTNSISDRAILGQFLVNWRGKKFSKEERDGFDLFNILDVPALITVTHNEVGDKTYANITGISGIPKGMEIKPRETDLLAYSPQDASKADNFDRLPKWLQDKCKVGHRMQDAPEHYPQAAPSGNPPMDYDDDIPF